MTLVYSDRVQETTTTTGTGTYTLAGAMTGFQSFAVVGNGNTCYYCITDGTSWEVGLGTYTSSGTTLARTSVLTSSNANAAVNWSAGTKTIWLDFPATVASYLAGGTTGTGAVARASSPAFVTPTLGAAMATSINFGGSTLSAYDVATATTPTVTSTVGTITSISCTLAYVKKGRDVMCTYTIVVTTNGTGAGQLKLPLPFAASPIYVGGGGVNFSAGYQTCVIPFDANNITIAKYDGTYPAASGHTLYGGFSYVSSS